MRFLIIFIGSKIRNIFWAIFNVPVAWKLKHELLSRLFYIKYNTDVIGSEQTARHSMLGSSNTGIVPAKSRKICFLQFSLYSFSIWPRRFRSRCWSLSRHTRMLGPWRKTARYREHGRIPERYLSFPQHFEEVRGNLINGLVKKRGNHGENDHRGGHNWDIFRFYR